MATKVIEFQTTKEMNDWLMSGRRKVMSVSSRRHLEKSVFWWAPLGALLLLFGQATNEPAVAPTLQVGGAVLAVLGFTMFWGIVIKTAWRYVSKTNHTVVYEAEVEPSDNADAPAARQAQ